MSTKKWRKYTVKNKRVIYECQYDIEIDTSSLSAGDLLGDSGLFLVSGSGACGTGTFNGLSTKIFTASSDSIVKWSDEIDERIGNWQRYIDGSLVTSDLSSVNEIPVLNGEVLLLADEKNKYNLKCMYDFQYLQDELGNIIIDELGNKFEV